MPSYQAVVFDFDYTLVDSSRAIVTCFNRALALLGMPTAEPAAICRTIGLPLRQSFLDLVAEEDRGRLQEFLDVYRTQADLMMTPMTELMPHASGALGSLYRCGLRLGIVSLKFRYRIRDFLAGQRLLPLFGAIVGSEDVTAPKPDPAGLLEAVRQLGVPTTLTLYVGDSVVDAETAQRAGTDFVAVTTGTTDAGAFAAYPCVAVLPSLEPLPRLAGCSCE